MSWRDIAEKDFRDAIRSWWLWGLSAFFFVIYTVPVYLVSQEIGIAAEEVAQDPEAAEVAELLTSDLIIQGTSWFGAHFIPVIAIVIAYAAVAGERDSGTIKMLLALPHSRRDVVLGKLVGRGAVLSIPIALGFVLSAFAILLTDLTFEALNFLLYAMLTILLGLVWVGISVGISASVRSGRQAMIGTVGVYVFAAVLWGSFTDGLDRLLQEYTSFGAETLTEIQLGLLLINPIEAYQTLVTSISTDPEWFGGEFTAEWIARSAVLDGRNNHFIIEDVPTYFSDPVVLLVLLIWLVVLPAVGYRAFRGHDL